MESHDIGAANRAARVVREYDLQVARRREDAAWQSAFGENWRTAKRRYDDVWRDYRPAGYKDRDLEGESMAVAELEFDHRLRQAQADAARRLGGQSPEHPPPRDWRLPPSAWLE